MGGNITQTAEIGVGRHIIREAFAKLEDDNLINREPHRGAYVREITISETLEILEVRLVLENYAIAQACKKVTQSQLKQLNHILRDMKGCVEKGELERYSELNAKFHEIIYEAAGTRTVSEVLTDLKTRLIRHQYKAALIPGRAIASLSQHEEIYKALNDGDVERAQLSVRRHVESLKDTLILNQSLLEIRR